MKPFAIILAGLLFLGHCAFSQEKTKTALQSLKFLILLPNGKIKRRREKSRKRFFFILPVKAGRTLLLPQYPDNALIGWSMMSYQKVGHEPKQLYTGLTQNYEQLLVAEHLFKNQDRRALRVSHNALFKISVRQYWI